MAFNDQGEHENAVQFDNLYIRLRWAMGGRSRPRPPPMATGFAAVASGHSLSMPLRSPTAFGTPLPKAFPWLRPSGPGPSLPRSSAPIPPPTPPPLVERPTKRPRVRAQQAGEADDPDDKAREVALESWAHLVTSMGESSELFVQMSRDGSTAEETFHAAFYGKPATTLGKRAAALGLYLRWASAHQVAPWPLKEEAAFRYVRYLVAHRAPPTRAQSFREALGFAKGYVGLAGVDPVLASRRVVGAVQEALDERAERVQRDVLTVPMVRFLEGLLSEDHGVELKVLVGFLLFCLHARARVGDAIRGDKEPTLDIPEADGQFGFVEAGFLKHKTSYRNRSKIRLPVVADAFGLSGVGWARLWLQARSDAGLDAERDGFLMPTVYGSVPDLRFGTGRATTAEISALLKEVLGGSEEEWLLGNTGAHSLKPTLLSWCAKFGLSLAVRRKLGGHAKARDKAVLAYSRDELAEPIRELQRMVAAVRAGSFDPDASRSGLLRATAADGGGDGSERRGPDEAGPDQVEPVPQPATPTPDFNQLSESSSEDQSEDEPEDGDEAADYFVNSANGIFHLRHEMDGDRLRCGRRIARVAGLCPAVHTAAFAQDSERCKGCFR